MRTATICIPLDAQGRVAPRLGQARAVATCRIDDGVVSKWTEHPVGWDNTYGVDVLGVHHPRVVRFMVDHEITDVIADAVCESVKRALASSDVSVHTKYMGEAVAAVGAFARAAA